MSASISNAQTPPIAASQNAAAANSSSSGSSANVAAGSAQPTARSSYANATKKISSPPIASSAAPPVAVGGQSAQNGSGPIKPAVPAMAAPTIVNSSNVNGTPSQGDHSRKSSITISAAGTSGYIANGGPTPNSRAPSNLTFGSLAGSPAPSHAAPHHPQGANLNPNNPNPRVASPAHSPSPIPTPISSGGKPDNLPTRPGMPIFGGSDSSEANARPISMPPQPNSLPQAQHLRRESSQSAHSDMSNTNMNRGFPPNGGRGRGFNPNYNPQMGHPSPQPFRPVPNSRGPGMPPPFQPQGPMHPNSPYRTNRSPAMTPATMHQQAHLANPQGMPYYPGQPYQQQMYMPQGLDPYQNGGYYGQNFGLQQSVHYPGTMPGTMPASPGRGHSFPQHMQGQYPISGPYGQPPQAQGMSRTPSNMSERPPSAVAQPSTPAMTNVNHVSHTHTPSGNASPAPSSSNFTIPSKKSSKAIVIKNADGEVVDFNKKASSPAPPTQPQPRSPAIVSTPTPPPRAPSTAESTHSRTDSIAAKTDKEKQADFVKQFQENLKAEKEKEEAEKKAKEEAEAKAKAEAEAKEKAEAEAKAAKEKEEAEKAAAEKAKADEAEKKRKEDEEFERMIAEMEAQEKEEEERERKFQEEKKRKDAEAKAKEADHIKEQEEKLRQQEREAEQAEAARSAETPEQKAEREALFASLKKNTQFGPAANAVQSTSGSSTPAETALPTPTQSKPTSAAKPKPAALKLETTKPVEPAQPTAGMQSLKSARFLAVKNESINYPEGIKSPNPALNLGSRGKGRQYDKEFLLQFQDVFKEKPAPDWDTRLRETVGDSSDSARPQSARPQGMNMGARQPSRTSMGPGSAMGNFQGSFGSGRTLPPGTTSADRFAAASRSSMPNPLAQFVAPNRPGSFGGPMAPPMARSGSFQNMSQAGPNSPRVGSSRGRGSRRGDAAKARKEEEQAAKAMPLTAGQEVKALERSTTGWTPHSRASAVAAGAGHLAPDVVQRKVKAALNKMTPEKFDKISDQILEIAAQSKDEQDGRTLRQVIQLTFEKACDEAHWASMYAKFCHRMLATMSPDIKDENVRDKHGNPVVGGALFRKYLLNRCQEEFEKGWQANLPEKPEGTEEAQLLSDDYYVAAAAKRRGLGLIQFIGELYKLGMLTLRIMHECVMRLLDFEGLPDEASIESLSKLLRTVGGTMESTETGPKMIAVYFERIEKIVDMESLPSRMKFMLMDVVDLRKAGWKSKDDAKGPKTIAEIHQEAAAAQQAAEMERTRSNARGPRPPIGRGDVRSFSGGGMLPPQDFANSRVQMDDLRKLSKGASGRNLNNPGQLGPSMLGSRSSSGRRGLGPGGGLMGRGDESGASSRTGTPPVQKEKESTSHANSFSALMSLDNEGAAEVGSPPSTASSPPQAKSNPARSKSPAVEAKEAKPSQ